MANTKALHGAILSDVNLPPEPEEVKVRVPGVFNSCAATLGLDDNILSKHILITGGTGSGKTSLFYYFIDQLRAQLTSDDVMVIFDTKGDFYQRFYVEGDSLISNSKIHADITDHWNIFKEIVADGWDNNDLTINTQEITRSLFREALKNNSQPFFPNAARDLLSAILVNILRIGRDDDDFKNDHLFNSALKEYFDKNMTAEKLNNFLKSSPDLSSVLSYIGDGTTDQGLGVIAELQSVIRDIFIGVFARKGGFSIRNFIREKNGAVLFVEYDLSIGNTLTPIYRLFFDLALKEALGRNKSEGNVYLICDEFKLLPHSQHIDDAVNFGRSLGVKVIAGLQSIEQLYEIYGESRGKNIASGFSSIIAFRANDIATRNYVSGLFGKNIVLESYKLINNDVAEDKRDGNTVEDWDMTSLEVGEAIVGLPFSYPFRFKFDAYHENG